MSQTVIQSKLNNLQSEVELLRSFVIGTVGKDPEGEYRPGFVREMMQIAQEKSIYTFTTKKAFLAHLRSKNGK